MSKYDSDSEGNFLFKSNGKIIFHLYEILEKRNMTRYALSKITNIRYDTICNYCNSKVTLINAEYLKIFCSVLKCKIGDIMEYVEEPKSKPKKKK